MQTFRARMEALLAKSCEGATSSNLAEGTENGFAFALWLQDCPLNKASGTPEFTLMKAIGGHDNLYVVQKAYRSQGTKEHVAAGMDLLRRVEVCDTRTPDSPCPESRPAFAQ